MVAHPINPPHVIPLVEVVPAPWTDPEVGMLPVILTLPIITLSSTCNGIFGERYWSITRFDQEGSR